MFVLLLRCPRCRLHATPPLSHPLLLLPPPRDLSTPSLHSTPSLPPLPPRPSAALAPVSFPCTQRWAFCLLWFAVLSSPHPHLAVSRFARFFPPPSSFLVSPPRSAAALCCFFLSVCVCVCVRLCDSSVVPIHPSFALLACVVPALSRAFCFPSLCSPLPLPSSLPPFPSFASHLYTVGFSPSPLIPLLFTSLPRPLEAPS